ncbi:hypothetical protein [Clostridium sp. AM58-1XD]|uniref:hypothetical protein n=1 Tax=Clostridium sp. AM58-1XD TaxID=2292307 RepID=UPI000E53E656|nr:hypothetical protein [Clostridium sp. AM58-1XD]RGY97922.1 hypothetical protein DXA13_12715 [Clostridium sp. AM58-1XD]
MSKLEDERKEPDKTDELSDMRREYEQADLEESLKRVLFGGYSKKKVNEVLSTYKEMIRWMQESFDYRLKELNEEKERVWNERVVLKKQLSAELEKNKKTESLKEEAERWKQQYEDDCITLKKQLNAQIEKNGNIIALKEEAERWKRQYKDDCAVLKKQLNVELEKNKKLDLLEEEAERWKQQYQGMKEKYERSYTELQRVNEEKTNRPAQATDEEGSSSLIISLTSQLEELTSYCESMEKQQRSLEIQISSMKNISQELERLSAQYEENQAELKDARLRYANVKNENNALNSEMESTGRILEEILEQFEQKEAENDVLRRQVDEFQEQLLAVKREKLTQEQANLSYMERAYTAERERQEDREELYLVKKELEELRKKCDSLEKSKVIKIQSVAEPKEAEISEKERIERILKRASSVAERAAEQGEKSVREDTARFTDGKEIL